MTSPDGFEPLGAANYSSLAAFAAKTQEDWEDEIRGEQETRWGTGVLGGLFQGLQQGKPFVVSLITAILDNGFGPDDGEPDGPFANATEALTSLRNRFRAKWGEIRTAAETADNALENAAAAAIDATDAAELADEIVASGNNIIKNPGFERQMYEQVGGQFVTTYSHSGNRSLRLIANGSTRSYTLLSTDTTPKSVIVDEDDIYYFSVMVRGDDFNTQTSGGEGGIVFLFEPFDKDNQPLTPISKTLTASTALNTGWTKLEGYVDNLPAGTRSMIMRLQLTSAVKSSPEPDKYYFDSVVVRESSLSYIAVENATKVDELARDIVTSGSNIIKNGGFESGLFVQGAGTFSTARVRSGERSLWLKRTALVSNPKYTFMSDETNTGFIPVVPGDVFIGSVWVRGNSSNSQTEGGLDGIKFVAQPYQNATPLLAQEVKLTAAAGLKDDWTELAAVFTMPATANRMKLSVELTSAVSNNESYFFDDCVLREVTLASEAVADAGTAYTLADTAFQNAQDVSDFAGLIVESGSNLIANSDFEKGLSPQPLVGTYSTDFAYSGTKSLKLVANGNTKTFYLLSEGLTPRTIPASPGDMFYCSMYVRGSGLTETVADGIRLIFEPTNRFGANLTDSYVGATVSTALNDTWTLVEAYAKMPPDTAKTKVAVQLRNTVTAGTLYVDQVIVREVTSAKAAQDTIDTKARDLTNLAGGSDFEGDIQPWTLGTGWSIATDEKYVGTKSLKHSGTSAGTSTLTGVFACLPGDEFLVETYARKNSAFNGTVNDRIRLINQAGSEVGFVGFGSAAITSADTWTKLSDTVTIPAGTSSFTVTAVSNSTAGAVWLDNIVIRRVVKPEQVAPLPQDKVTDLPSTLTTINDTAVTADQLAIALGASNNMVMSPDFDEPAVRRLVGASVSGVFVGEYSTDTYLTGTHSYKIRMTAAGADGNYGGVYLNPINLDDEPVYYNIAPGQKYNFDIVFFCPNANTSSKNLGMWGGYRLLSGGNGVPQFLVSTAQVKGSWQRWTGDFTIPATVNDSPPLQMLIGIGFHNNAVGAVNETVYFDRCIIYRV